MEKDEFKKLIESISEPLKEDWVVHDDIYVKPKTKVALKAWETRRKKENPLLDKKVDLYFEFNELKSYHDFGILNHIDSDWIIYTKENGTKCYVPTFRLIKIVRRDE